MKPVMRPEMKCCANPKPKWVSRLKATPAVFKDGVMMSGRKLNERVRAYVCQNCGKQDR